MRQTLTRTLPTLAAVALLLMTALPSGAAMVAQMGEDFVFKVIDPAVVPEEKAAPKRALMVILGAFLGAAVSVMAVLVVGAFSGSRARPRELWRIVRADRLMHGRTSAIHPGSGARELSDRKFW